VVNERSEQAMETAQATPCLGEELIKDFPYFNFLSSSSHVDRRRSSVVAE
jgi:hypothetical protein